MAPGTSRRGVSGEASPERVHAVVRGRVQGVGFRWFVQRTAADLELDGWVMNRSDRAVELVAEGPGQRLDELLAAVRQGPPASSVDSVEVSRSPARHDLRGFHIESGGHSGD
jgi:acylphosphatase